jgi:hypothetical protein
MIVFPQFHGNGFAERAMLTFLREWLWRCFVGWVVFRLRRRASGAARSAAFGLTRKRAVRLRSNLSRW